eukprot:1620246-Pleurochrysis_carterae.AAC.1
MLNGDAQEDEKHAIASTLIWLFYSTSSRGTQSVGEGRRQGRKRGGRRVSNRNSCSGKKPESGLGARTTQERGGSVSR